MRQRDKNSKRDEEEMLKFITNQVNNRKIDNKNKIIRKKDDVRRIRYVDPNILLMNGEVEFDLNKNNKNNNINIKIDKLFRG